MCTHPHRQKCYTEVEEAAHSKEVAWDLRRGRDELRELNSNRHESIILRKHSETERFLQKSPPIKKIISACYMHEFRRGSFGGGFDCAVLSVFWIRSLFVEYFNWNRIEWSFWLNYFQWDYWKIYHFRQRRSFKLFSFVLNEIFASS